jgi:hypothetical protein
MVTITSLFLFEVKPKEDELVPVTTIAGKNYSVLSVL